MSFEFQVVDESELTLVAPGLDFADVREIVVDADAVWVLDDAPPFLTRIPHNGSQVVRFAQRGEGPQDLSWPVAVQPDGGGGIRVWDRGNRRVLSFGATGALIASEPLEPSWAPRTRRNIGAITYADPLRIRLWGDHALAGFYPQGANRTPDIVQGSLRWATALLEPQVSVLHFSEATDLSTDNMREFASVPLWDACDGHVVYWNPKDTSVSWIDQDQAVAASVELGVTASALTLSDIERYVQAMARLELGPGSAQRDIDFAAMARSRRDQFAQLAPIVVDVRCEPGPSVWVQLFDTDTDPLGRSAKWLKVATEGGIVGLEFPEGFHPKSFTGAGIYGAYSMVDGASRIARWKPFDSAPGI